MAVQLQPFLRLGAGCCLLLLLLLSVAVVLPVSAGRLYGYTDSACTVGETSASFVSSTCYPSGSGSVSTACGSVVNSTRAAFTWRYDRSSTSCKQWTGSVSGWDGDCVRVGVGNVGSIRVDCAAAHTTAAVPSLMAALLLAGLAVLAALA